MAPGERLLIVRTGAGDDRLIAVPDELDPDRVLAFLLALDGRRSYAELVTNMGATLDDVLAIGRFLGQKGVTGHGSQH